MAIEIKYSVYPFALDGTNQLPIVSDNITEVNAEVVNRHRSAIIAIEGELGIDPSGVYSTVRARLDALEALIGSGGSGITSVYDEGVLIDSAARSINFTGDVVQATTDGSGNITVTVDGVLGSGSAGDQVQETIPVTTPGQTSFTISSTPSDETTVQMFINGLKQLYGTEYTVSGTTVSYLADGYYSLSSTDDVEFWYIAESDTGITIQDEGVTVESNTSIINFIGADVLANSGGTGTVNVYIPPPNYLSHWDTSDGANGAQLVTESISRSTTRIATPAGGEGTPFNTGGWAATNQDTTLSGVVTFTTPGATTGFGGDSTMTVTVYDADGSTPLDTYTTPAISANGANVSGSGRITVTISSYGADSLRFSANASIEVNVAGVLSDNGLTGGRYHVEITHTTDSTTDGTGPYTYTQSDVFYDTNPSTPSISTGVSIAETGGSVVTKHLSGIEYYDLGSDFTVDITDIDNHNNNTSRTTASVLLRGTEYGLPDLDHSPFGTGSANFIGWSNDHDDAGTDYQKTDWEITEANYRYIGPTGNVTAQVRDTWGSSAVEASADDEILIDTYGTTSTNLVENFDDEARRQDGYFNSGTTAGNWDSTATLGVDSISGENEAIVFNSKLMAPSSTTFVRTDGADSSNTDWSTYLPNAGGANPDYTGQGVPVVYYRSFIDTSGLSRSSFTMTFTGDFVSDATTDLANSDLEITIYKISGTGSTGAPPTNTQPLFAHSSVYNFATFDDGLTDGQIRLGSSSGNTVECTFGIAPMEDGVFCEIRINNSNIEIDSITFTFN